MLAIETDHLSKSFGSKRAVNQLNLQVPIGCVYGFLGPNGAGKTTAMRLIVGLLKPDEGAVRIMGQDVKRDRAKALSMVGASFEGASLYDHLTGRDNLDLTRQLLRLPKAEVTRVLEIVDLRQTAGQRVATFSLGMKQRLVLARALLGSPRLLILDEPTNGLDPQGIVVMRNLIKDLPNRIDGTVFLSSHLLSEVELVAERILVIDGGQQVAEGAVRDLLSASHVICSVLDRAQEAASMLLEKGFEITEVTGRTIKVIAPKDQRRQEFAAKVNRAAVEAGFEVHAVSAEARSLEDLYERVVPRRSKPTPLTEGTT